MKFKLSIIIFTIILLVFYLQTVSCKNKPQEPEAVYSNYIGYLANQKPSAYDPVKYDYYTFVVKGGPPPIGETYSIMDKSDMDKLKDYLYKPNITIRATYSNTYLGYKYNYLFDCSIVE